MASTSSTGTSRGSVKLVLILKFPADPTGQANILIDKNNRACLADFGLSTVAYVVPHVSNDTNDIPLSTEVSRISMDSKMSLMPYVHGGTERWMSPELLEPELFGVAGDRPTKKSDIYALGMVVYEVCCFSIVVEFPD